MADETTQPDTDLALRAQAGDRRAFDLLIQRYKGPLYRFVRRYVGDDDDAYDIVQDAFISAWMALRRYDPHKSFGTWLRAIALNKCRDFGRRRAVRLRILRLFADETPRISTANAQEPGSEQASLEAKRLHLLDEAIASLSQFYKEPLLLTMAGGLSQQEAATILKTSVKAIEMRIRRARKKLSEALSDLKGDDANTDGLG